MSQMQHKPINEKKMSSIKRQHKILIIITYVFISIIGIIFLLPFVWMISSSLKTLEEIFQPGLNLLVKEPHWDNYVKALNAFPFFTYLKNTLITTIIPIIGVTLSSSLVAFGFARIKAPGSNILFLIVLATMMIPSHVTMIPVFILFRNFNWINTLYPLIVPAFFGTPFFIFLMRQFFMRMPSNLEDAARIDGCSTFQIWAKIFLPLSWPAITTVAIFEFMGKWNDFMGPLIYINSERLKTLSLGLMSFEGQYTTDINLLMAATLVVILPCIVLFFLAQRYFIEGITFTGSKE